MGRPVKCRRICALPGYESFGPCSQAASRDVEMALDEYEAIRLIDLLGLTQEEAARQMGVARTTVQAVYDAARGKIADALVNGHRLLLRGGRYELCPNAEGCCARMCAGRGCQRQETGCVRRCGCPTADEQKRRNTP